MSPRWRSVLLALLCLWPMAGTAQSGALADLFVETWTTRDGLPHNLVLDIAQTPDGYLWFATWEGVVRFNGHEFVVRDRANLAALSDNGIRALHVGPSGSLWIATARGGVVRQRAGEWAFVGEEIGLDEAQIMSVVEQSDQVLWILTEDAGLERRTAGGAHRRFDTDAGLPSNVGYGMALDSRGRMLVATGEGLGVIDGDAVSAISGESGLPRGPVLSVRVGPDGMVYLGTERGAYRADSTLTFSSVHPELEKEAVQALWVDPDGSQWFGTIANGLYRLRGGELEHLGVNEGLPNGRVAAIFRDQESSLWLSTNAGLVRLREAPIRSLGTAAGMDGDYVRTVIEDAAGQTWVGGSDGLSVWRNGRFTPIGVDAALPGRSILALGLAHDGGLWVGTYYNGLAKLRDGVVTATFSEEDGLPSNSVRCVIETEPGVVWVGTSRGLAKISPSGVRRYGQAEGLPRELVISMHQDRAGRLWVGTTKGLAEIQGDTLRAIDLTPFGGVQRVFGFADDEAGSVWMATDRGLLRRQVGDEDRIEHIGTSNGLPYESLFAVVLDRDGGLWASSNRGLVRLDLADATRALGQPDYALTVERFGEADGMASQQANGGSSPSGVRRADGSVWFATAKGIASVRPENRQAVQMPAPRVAIERLRVDDELIETSGDLKLPVAARRVEIGYAGVTFLQANHLRYRYRMEGFDPDWVDAGGARSAQFTNLPPGAYLFRVAAARPGGEWSEAEARLRIEVRPQFWQQGGFMPGLALLALVMVYVLYRLRVRQLQADAQRLAALVDERTSELRGHTERLEAADAEKSTLLTQFKQQSEAFALQAREDQLTGLANRRAFDEALTREFARAARNERPLALALIDIDHFKRVNDAYSHAAGDAVLQALAVIMLRACREVDLVARWGGEEFALLLPDTTLAAAEAICERLRLAVADFDASEIAPGLRITISAGIAVNTGLTHHERMLVRADEHLYAAKQAGRNRVMR